MSAPHCGSIAKRRHAGGWSIYVTACEHKKPRCLNPFELIRKYECEDCGVVVMCACDESIGRRFLPHQLEQGSELETRRRVPVTGGFQAAICRECRGLPPEPHPMASIRGRTSKIKRYYWRELAFREMELFAEWADEAGGSGEVHTPAAVAARNRAAQQALAEIKELHASTPKYVFRDQSQREVIEQHKVKVVDIGGTYIDDPGGRRARLLDGDEEVPVEEFVARYFDRRGLSPLPLESRPFHVLFGIYMWLVVQDPSDPRVRIVGFGDRSSFESGEEPEEIWTHLPEDFGSPGYGKRRASEIEEHLDLLTDDQLDWLFDYWLEPSANLRQYLWAHREEDIARARQLIEILPAEVIRGILRYLIDHYWGRYLGWPDLLVFDDTNYVFVEVKSSKDKLSQDQMRWIRDNDEILRLPFKLARVHRRRTVARG